jgi:hypothetical protein
VLNEIINIETGFQSSVNIAFDLYNDEKLKHFIPTVSAIDVIEEIMLSIAPSSTNRAYIFTGAYGRGKSHVVLVILSLLFKKDKNLFEALLRKIAVVNPKLYEYVIEYLESERKLLPIIINGNNANLSQSFLSALQHALYSAGLDNLMPETHFQAALTTIENWRANYKETFERFTYALDEAVDDFVMHLQEYDVSAYERFIELYPTLTSGSVFNPFIGFDVVELYEKVTEELCKNGYNGIFIVYDEFSKYLESSIKDAPLSDIKLLQDFAEKCDRSGEKQMHLLLISHKDITNYIDEKLPKEKVDGWRAISGRFKYINFHNNYSQMYEIIAAVIKKNAELWEKFCNAYKPKFDALYEYFGTNEALDIDDDALAEVVIKGCYPLHPISTFILPRLSEKVAQNERTLFTFLSSVGKNTLYECIESADADFPLFTPDVLYDYFEPIMRKESYISEVYDIYKLASTVLKKVKPASLESKIIKTIALIYITEQFEKLPPTYDILVEIFKYATNGVQDISNAVNNLIEKDCVVYLKRSNGFLKLKENIGINIKSEINKALEKIRISKTVADILNSVISESYMYPTRYNEEHEIIRYFDFAFMDSDAFFSIDDWEEKLCQSKADGIVVAIVPHEEKDIELVRNLVTNGCCKSKRVVFAIPRTFMDIEEIAYEYLAVLNFKESIADDEELSDECDIYIEDLGEIIGSFYMSYARPENGKVDYYNNGQKCNIYRRAQLSALLSKICEETYIHTPIINNESINKNYLSPAALKSRNKVIAGLLADKLEPNLGLSGNGQEVSIMRSTLVRTGIIENCDSKPFIQLEPRYSNMAYVLGVIQSFFAKTNSFKNGQSFSELYEHLTLPEYGIGLKLGVIPIYIAVVLRFHKKDIVIKHKSQEVLITPELFDNINDNPEDYFIIIDDWNEDKARYISALEGIFSEYIVEKEKTYDAFSYIVSAMNRWYLALPKYVKDLSAIYMGNGEFAPLPKYLSKFMSSLKQFRGNSREYLFNKLFTIYDYVSFDLAIVNDIAKSKEQLDFMLMDLLSKLSEDVKTIFGNAKERASVSSVVRDWYESLKPETVQYLFPNNENAILELFRTATPDDSSFMQRLCKAASGLRIDDWNEATIKAFLNYCKTFKETVEGYNNGYDALESKAQGVYQLIFKDINGQERVRTFEKIEYSPKAKLLLNDINAAINEMGQSISEQEKRQVLLEALERLC